MILKALVFLFVLSIFEIEGSSTNRTLFRADYSWSVLADGWLKLHVVPAVWSDARLKCHAEGAVLASPLSKEVRAAMMQLASVEVVFTGVHATHSQGDYASVEGVPLSHLAVSWAAGQPDNRDNAERCLAMTPVNGSLSDVSCSRTLPYICYKKNAPLEITSCGTTDPDYALDERTGHCYKFHPRGLTWSRGAGVCAAEGAHLAIVNGEDEAQLLYRLFNEHPQNTILPIYFRDFASIGFLDWQDGGSWMTIHGGTLKEAGYATWTDGQPTNVTRPPLYSPALCGALHRSGGLSDVACDLSLPFICEMKPGTLQRTEHSL